jgi:hypothetical protein
MKVVNAQYFGFRSRDFFTLVILYTLAHAGTFLILNAVYWDDWTLYNINPTSILHDYAMYGWILSWPFRLHNALLPIGPWIYRILTFILMFITGMSLWKVIELNNWIAYESRFIITLLFLVLPFNWSRIEMINFMYVLCLFAFFSAWYFTGRNRLLALCLFLFSFSTNSLLVFFALPMADWYFRDNNTYYFKSSSIWVLKRIDFIISPFAFWIVKRAYFRPYGLLAGYNEHFSVKNLIISPVRMARDFVHLDINVFLCSCLFIFCMVMIRKQGDDNHERDGRKMLIAGSAALICAVFPYWIIGDVPTFFEWTSRHQLLMPLGVALLLTYMLGRITTDTRRFATAILITVSISISIQTYCELSLDWSKQRELMSLFSHDDKIRDAGLVIFDDHTDNARNRVYGFYEWNGLMKYALKDERRFGLNPDEVNSYMQGDFDQYSYAYDNASLHVRQPNEIAAIVRIEYADKNAGFVTRVLRSIRGKANYKIIDNNCDHYCLDKLGGLGASD